VVIAALGSGPYSPRMRINRTGPPKTHDRVTWRVPLSGPPSIRWQHAFLAADESTPLVTAGGVRFEEVALTFRSREEHVPVWIQYIDRWIAHANVTEADVDDRQRHEAEHTREQRDAQRKEADAANEKFKDL
jgi:hypothetical protein